MGSRKGSWRHAVICIMLNTWVVGCANNESIAPISSIANNSDGIGDKVMISYRPKSIQFHANATNIEPINISPEERIIYNRSYENIQQGFYDDSIYEVKRGDTLFYIAWITGNDYRDLAIKNNIKEPYSLKVGQTLQVSSRIRPIIGNISSKSRLVANRNNANTEIITSSIPTPNTKLIKSRIDINKNNNFSENADEKNIGKILPSLNGKMLPTSDTVFAKPVPLAATIPTTGSTLIANWRWPATGKIINTFSSAESGNKGIDISGSRGQPVLATASGRVVYAGNALRGYGNLIIIKHNDDYLSAYAHNDTMLVCEQEEVKGGQKIATMGSTGSSSVRLHFEIRYKGKSINPSSYLPKR